MAEGGWGSGECRDGTTHPAPGIGYMTSHPPPQYPIFQVPNYPPPPVNGYTMPSATMPAAPMPSATMPAAPMPSAPMPFTNDMFGNVAVAQAAVRGRGNWGYTNDYSISPNRTHQYDKSYNNYNANIPLHSPVSLVDVNTSYNANVAESNATYSSGNRTVAQENFGASVDMMNENLGSGGVNRGRGGARGQGSRGRRGGRRRPYGGDRGGGVGSYVGRPDPGEFLDQVSSDELKRAGRDRALAETAAFMRNLNMGSNVETTSMVTSQPAENVCMATNQPIGNISMATSQPVGNTSMATSQLVGNTSMMTIQPLENISMATFQPIENDNTYRSRGGNNRRRPSRARGGSYGVTREFYGLEKQGKEWKNRQVRTEEYTTETPVNKSSKVVKEQNGVGIEKRLWSDVEPKASVVPEDSAISRSEGLIEQLSRGVYECMVCCDRIKQPHAIWSCQSCYNCFHLGCIKKWAKTSAGDGGWRCPACQGFTSKVPNTYLCFCGKLREPEWNHRETAHSCGETCGRKRKIEWCKHKCNILCHPGPCPPCTAFFRRSCPCGAEKRDVRCSIVESFLCGNTCKKTLNCGGHQCQRKCHIAPCEDCAELVKQSCYCDKENREVPCTEESFGVSHYECGKECSRLLECGNHKCLAKCHAGKCQRCERAIDAVLRCPCDKVPLEKIYERDGVLQRKSCSDPIPTCGQVCGRKLKCGVPGSYHECQAMCHEGPCPPCPLATPVKCRCGSLDQDISCSELTTKADEVRCKKPCKKMRECGRHKCNVRCCIDIDHICLLICGRTLTCGLHKCDDTCHRGNCRRCIETSFEELTCHCGAQVTYPPVPCGTKPPECSNPCIRPQTCSHRPTHNCHPEEACPPCTILVDKPCFGNHKTMKSTPCYLNAISCGAVCNQPLPCGQHFCLLVCHGQPCVGPKTPCPQKCLRPRDTCGHPCASPCHSGPCPDVTCKEMVTITCECGHRTSMLKCSENDREYRAMTTSLLHSQMQNMNSGCSVDISEIFTATARPDKLRRLICNEDCKTLERNRRLAVALQIENPESREILGNSSSIYSDFMKEEARKDPNLAKLVHDTLTELVMKARESKQKSRSHSFAPMNRDKRRFIHEYCEHFGSQSQAYDEEPKKNVVATAVKGMCYLPPISVLTQVQREQGQKKVPGPVWARKVVPT